MSINGRKEVHNDSELEDYIKACEKAKEKADGKRKKTGDTADQEA